MSTHSLICTVYTLASELYPGSYRPTVTHAFIRLLCEKKKLHTCFTQNIDTLERRAGVPPKYIFEAHGSFATQRCRCSLPAWNRLVTMTLLDQVSDAERRIQMT